jgi:hypothetical protein
VLRERLLEQATRLGSGDRREGGQLGELLEVPGQKIHGPGGDGAEGLGREREPRVIHPSTVRPNAAVGPAGPCLPARDLLITDKWLDEYR